VVGGIAFHILTAIYLRILFAALMACYVAFVDWAALLAAAGRRLFRSRLLVAYDGRARSSRRLVAVLKAVDVLRTVDWWDSASGARRPSDDGELLLLAAPHRGVGSRPIALRLLARLPLALPLLPILPWLARGGAAGAGTRAVRHRERVGAVAPALVGGALLAANVYCGLFAVDSWPFSIFPRFAGIARPESTGLEILVRDPTGATTPVNPGLRRRALVRLLPARGGEQAQLDALLDHLARHEVTLSAGERLEVYEVTRSTAPEDRLRAPLRRTLIAQREGKPAPR
jgi:hypothetical protein